LSWSSARIWMEKFYCKTVNGGRHGMYAKARRNSWSILPMLSHCIVI
jgi:hypothetical protein